MYLLSFTTGGVKIAQQENDGHCAGKRFFPMLRFSMHKQRKKSIFFSFTFFFFFIIIFSRRKFPVLLPYEPKESKVLPYI